MTIDTSYKEGFAYHYYDSFENAKAELGVLFCISKVFTIPAPTGTTRFIIKTGEKQCHGIFTFSSSALTTLEMYYNSTVSNNGTPVDISNYYINSQQTHLTTAYINPTITNNGTKFYETLAIGSGGRNAIGANTTDPRRIVIPPFQTYQFVFTTINTGVQAPPDNLYRAVLHVEFFEIPVLP